MEGRLLKQESKSVIGVYKGECGGDDIPIFREVSKGGRTTLEGDCITFIDQKLENKQGGEFLEERSVLKSTPRVRNSPQTNQSQKPIAGSL
jgi:hypothetical protein